MWLPPLPPRRPDDALPLPRRPANLRPSRRPSAPATPTTTPLVAAAPPPTTALVAAAPTPDDPGFVFPPSRDSAIWRHLEHICSQQINTPRIVVGRAGTEDGAAFEAHLIEDARDDEGAGGGRFSFGQFLDFQAAEVEDYLKQMSGQAIEKP